MSHEASLIMPKSQTCILFGQDDGNIVCQLGIAERTETNMDLGLNGKTVLVTGASQGIGEGVARGFAAEGCHLHLVARSAERLGAIKAEIEKSQGVRVVVHALDLTAPGAIDPLVEAVGDIDILVNNAGVIPSGSLWDVDEAKWRAGWELKGFGYMAFTRAMGGHSLDDKIRVVGVNPGPVDTDRIYNMLKKRSKDWFGTEDRYKELQDRYPLKRPAPVHEVTDLIVFLASYRSGYTSGTIFPVDGGIASRRSVI